MYLFCPNKEISWHQEYIFLVDTMKKETKKEEFCQIADVNSYNKTLLLVYIEHNTISKFLVQDSLRHIFWAMKKMHHTFWKKRPFTSPKKRTYEFVFLSWRLGNTWNLNFDFKFQVFLSRQDRKINSFVHFSGRSYTSNITIFNQI